MNVLPSELVELVIEFAFCDKFVLLKDGPVYTLRLVEHPFYPMLPDGWFWTRVIDDEGTWVHEVLDDEF